MDVDFLMRGPNNDLARMDEIIVEILTVDTGNDFAAFKKVQGNPTEFRVQDLPEGVI